MTFDALFAGTIKPQTSEKYHPTVHPYYLTKLIGAKLQVGDKLVIILSHTMASSPPSLIMLALLPDIGRLLIDSADPESLEGCSVFNGCNSSNCTISSPSINPENTK